MKTVFLYFLIFSALFFLHLSCDRIEIPDNPVIFTVPVSDLTSSSAVCGGRIISDQGVVITGKGVCWNIRGDPTLHDEHTRDGAGPQAYASLLTGLVPGTTYYARAYTSGEYGIIYGNQVIFSSLVTGSFTDNRDGHVYGWVKIGSQVWMSENLAYLPEVSHPSTGSEENPFFYVYGYEGNSVSEAIGVENYKSMGVLYNWPAAMTGKDSIDTGQSLNQGVCPAGWHMPADEEWQELENYLGGHEVAGAKLKSTGTTYASDGFWNGADNLATNETGFSAQPGGYRYRFGEFQCGGCHAYFWSGSPSRNNHAWFHAMNRGNGNVLRVDGSLSNGLSVRCIKNN